MAKDKKKESSTEGMESSRIANVKNTLENKVFQMVLGSNLVKINPFMYGELGLTGADTSYDKATAGDEFGKLRQSSYQTQLNSMRKDGVYGEPSMPSNGQISQRIMRQIREVVQMAKLGELEKYVQDNGESLDFEVPEELKGYSLIDLVDSEGKINESKLDKKGKAILHFQGLLGQAYERVCALKTCKPGYFADINSMGNRILEEYRKAEE